jgi:hypothetical protein
VATELAWNTVLGWPTEAAHPSASISNYPTSEERHMDRGPVLFDGEKMSFKPQVNNAAAMTDEDINDKYVKGEVRIVTEQARYPLNTIAGMVESNDYELSPEFQRRHRWSPVKQARLIESFIMNVPVPPIFLYEDVYSHYEVMDGLQRLTAISDFYENRLQLEGLQEWPELNGKRYFQLPDQIRRGVDRRYLSSIILLRETARDEGEAQRLKQLVFERINSGGIQLEPQETRNAIYNGPMNQLCIRLARNMYLCRTWSIPEPTAQELNGGAPPQELMENERFRKMEDVELVLRFFAHRQRALLGRGALKDYLDNYLKHGNLLTQPVLDKLMNLFEQTTELVYETLGQKAFWLWRHRLGHWAWLERPTTVAYDAIMFVFSQHLDQADQIIAKSELFRDRIRTFYQEHSESFEARYTNRSNLLARDQLFEQFVTSIVTEP